MNEETATTTASKAENTTANNDSTIPPILEDPRQPMSIAVETTIRVTAAGFCGYCLAYSTSLDTVIPSTMKWLLGFLAPVLVMRVPPLAATILGSLGIFYTALMVGLCSVTCLLAAITVSDEFFLIMVALWTLWMSGLRYGATGKPLNVVGSALCVFLGMLGLGLHRSIRDGVSISLSRSSVRQLTLVELPELLEEALQSPEAREKLLQGIQDKVADLQEETLQARAEGLVETVSTYLPVIHMALTRLGEIIVQGCTDLTIPVGHLAGRIVTACIEPNTGNLTISIQGGFWMVKLFWTAGAMHPLAVFPNLIVICSWVFLCVYVSPMLPLPAIRTLRFRLSRITLPQALQDASWYLQADHARAQQSKTDTDIDVDQWIQEEQQVRQRLIAAVQTLHEGKIGLATAFEPRLLDYRFGIPCNTWIPLKKLTANVEVVALKALATKVIDPVQSKHGLLDAIVELQQVATVLADPTRKSLVMDHETKTKTKREAIYALTGTAAARTTAASAEMEGGKNAPNDPVGLTSNDPMGFENLSAEVTKATSVWLESMHATTSETTSLKEGAKHALVTLAVWTLPSLVLLGRLVQILSLPFLAVFKKGYAEDHWDLAKFFHCIKFATGFTLLVAMSVYWDAYHDLSVTHLEDEKGYGLVTGNPPSSFAGWDLIAYVFATMPTTEGTVKKSFLRIWGTCVGGFSAWALIHATGENAIGSVLWLTITTAIGVFATVDHGGRGARFGASEDFGYGGFYLVLTQAVIVMEYHAGLGEGNELVANRIVANVVGILMAVFVSLIPPGVMGSSPKYTKLLYTEACHGLSQAAQILSNPAAEASEKTMRELQSSFLNKSNSLHSDAAFLLKDAKRMNSLPIFHVAAELEEELDALMITSAGIAAIMGQAADLVAYFDTVSKEEGSVELSDLQEALKAIAQEKNQVDLDIDPRLGGSPAENLVASFEILQSRLPAHRMALEKL